MSPTEIKESLTDDELRRIYHKFGESEISRNQMIASIMFMMKMGETEAAEFVDWNLAELGQMEVDLEIRNKINSENSNTSNL
ncbi:hypothetical protein EHQ43_08745 [Leptospira bouyouniensis]|uniref:Uncharacterized protein n=1 Tax=Leptospira bouyouniensis TaxID=2484911 RepID=A0A7I0INY2_9LEPT|nr:hypothetical protein [Leptospira bouyouniensis]TGL06489.1 hypothetical protein EHQ43_08745 [Leptospira bouyouniensis]